MEKVVRSRGGCGKTNSLNGERFKDLIEWLESLTVYLENFICRWILNLYCTMRKYISNIKGTNPFRFKLTHIELQSKVKKKKEFFGLHHCGFLLTLRVEVSFVFSPHPYSYCIVGWPNKPYVPTQQEDEKIYHKLNERVTY